MSTDLSVHWHLASMSNAVSFYWHLARYLSACPMLCLLTPGLVLVIMFHAVSVHRHLAWYLSLCLLTCVFIDTWLCTCHYVHWPECSLTLVLATMSPDLSIYWHLASIYLTLDTMSNARSVYWQLAWYWSLCLLIWVFIDIWPGTRHYVHLSEHLLTSNHVLETMSTDLSVCWHLARYLTWAAALMFLFWLIYTFHATMLRWHSFWRR